MCRQDKMRYFLQLVQKLLLLECYCLNLLLANRLRRKEQFLHKSKRFLDVHSNKPMLNRKYLELQKSNFLHHQQNILQVFHQFYRKLIFYLSKMINHLRIKLYHLILHKQLLLQNLDFRCQCPFLLKLC